MNRIPGVMLILFSMIWFWYWFGVRTQVDMVVRRELQAFDLGFLDYLTLVKPSIDPNIWSQIVVETEKSIPSLRAYGSDETFEQMRTRHAKHLRIPIWPGLLALISGILVVTWTPHTEPGSKKGP